MFFETILQLLRNTLRWGVVCGAVILLSGTVGTLAADEPAGENVASRMDAAREHFQKGRYDEALEAYEELAREGADAPRVAIGRSRCLEAQGARRQATQAVQEAVDQHPGDAGLLARLAELHLAQGAQDLALEALEQALQVDPDHPLARIVQADAWAASGKLAEADDGYRWFVKFYNRTQPTDPETLMLVARGATEYARRHKVTDVFHFVINTLCPDALQQDKNFWQAHLVAGRLLLEKYNRGQAMPELRAALKINPRAADVQTALAEAALQDHLLSEAEQLADRALAINPRHVAALLVLADLRLEDGDFPQARKQAEQALEVNPHDERVQARLAACDLFEDGAPPAAELDELFANLDAIDEAAIKTPARFSRRLIDVARRNPHPGWFLTLVGERLEARKQFDLAERCYRQAIESLPKLAGPRNALGMLYMRVGRNADAAKILDAAFAVDPYHVRVSNMRKVLRLLEGYETIATDHFVIRVDGQADRILGRYMAEFLEEEYPALVQQFRYEPPARTQFEIFNKAKGLSGHQWFSARMVGLPWVQTIGASTGMIVALASPTASEKPFNWARVLKHEFVHILTLQQTNFNIPHWYTEALAVTSEGYPPPELWNRLLLERVPADQVMNLDNINLGFIRPRTPTDWNMAYCQSFLYARYMTEKFGPDATARLLDAYRRNLSTDQALPETFGVDKQTFEKGYREYLDGVVAGLRGTLPEPPVTLAQAEKAHRAAPNDPRPAARYALELFKINRRKDARKLAETVLETHPAEPLAAVVMAQLALRGEDPQAAIARLEPALDRTQPHPLVLGLLAELQFKQGQYDAAIALYEQGLTHDPSHLPWLKGLAASLLKAGRTDELRAVLEKLSVTDGDDAPVRQKLAEMALAREDFAATVRYARMALHIDVLDVDTHCLLAKGYAGLARHDQAAAEWTVALELKPDDPKLTVELAQSEAAAGHTQAAEKRLRTLLEQHPDFEPAQAALQSLADAPSRSNDPR
ncbi:MAG: tetratricopeptide repeat protein [Planctomycetales bacterium]